MKCSKIKKCNEYCDLMLSELHNCHILSTDHKGSKVTNLSVLTDLGVRNDLTS